MRPNPAQVATIAKRAHDRNSAKALKLSGKPEDIGTSPAILAPPPSPAGQTHAVNASRC